MNTVDLPAIVLSGGPMLDGWHDGKRVGSGTVIWHARNRLAAGAVSYTHLTLPTTPYV